VYVLDVKPDMIEHVCCMTCHKLSYVCNHDSFICTSYKDHIKVFQVSGTDCFEMEHMSTWGSLSGSPLGQGTLDLG